MVQALSDSPLVLGLIEYGSSSATDAEVIGDYDLIVVLNHEYPNVESLHFYVDGNPVDLNLRSLDEIRTMKSRRLVSRASCWTEESSTIQAGVLYKRLKTWASGIDRSPPETMSAESIAFARHGTKHIFDKVERRIHSNPTLCAFLLHQNVYWLIHNYRRAARHRVQRGTV